jgi:hypothetical protein
MDSLFISLIFHIENIPHNNKEINTFGDEMAQAREKPASPLGLETPRLAAGSLSH